MLRGSLDKQLYLQTATFSNEFSLTLADSLERYSGIECNWPVDFDDLQNYRTGKAAQDAADAARANAVELERLRQQLNDQTDAQRKADAKAQLEKALAAQLFEFSQRLERDFHVLSYEPSEEVAIEIAKYYKSHDPIDAFINHQNHPALEYKELATKTKDIYDQLLQNGWYKWGFDKCVAQEEEERRRQLAQEQLEHEQKAERRAAQIVKAQAKLEEYDQALEKSGLTLAHYEEERGNSFYAAAWMTFTVFLGIIAFIVVGRLTNANVLVAFGLTIGWTLFWGALAVYKIYLGGKAGTEAERINTERSEILNKQDLE